MRQVEWRASWLSGGTASNACYHCHCRTKSRLLSCLAVGKPTTYWDWRRLWALRIRLCLCRLSRFKANEVSPCLVLASVHTPRNLAVRVSREVNLAKRVKEFACVWAAWYSLLAGVTHLKGYPGRPGLWVLAGAGRHGWPDPTCVAEIVPPACHFLYTHEGEIDE